MIENHIIDTPKSLRAIDLKQRRSVIEIKAQAFGFILEQLYALEGNLGFGQKEVTAFGDFCSKKLLELETELAVFDADIREIEENHA